MIVLHLLTILFTVSGVQMQWCPNNYPCAVRGFSATILCKHANLQDFYGVQICTVNTSGILNYVKTDSTSDCTLFIPDVQFSSAGVYRFTFTAGNWTDYIKVTLKVSDLKVSLIRISGNGTIEEGDSLNLTCDLTCTHDPSEFIWSKNIQNINQSGPVLHFPNVTVRDSGYYTCTWRRNESWGSDSIFLHVEDSADQNPDRCSQSIAVAVVVVVVVLVVGGILIGLVVAAVIHNKRRVQTEQQHDNSDIYADIQ